MTADAIAAASEWLAAAESGQFVAAWQALDPAYRRWLAEKWVESRGGASALGAEFLASAAPGASGDAAEAWEAHAELAVTRILFALPVGVVEHGWVERRHEAPDGYTLLLLVDREAVEAARRESDIVVTPAVTFLMHETEDGWRVAGVNVTEPPRA